MKRHWFRGYKSQNRTILSDVRQWRFKEDKSFHLEKQELSPGKSFHPLKLQVCQSRAHCSYSLQPRLSYFAERAFFKSQTRCLRLDLLRPTTVAAEMVQAMVDLKLEVKCELDRPLYDCHTRGLDIQSDDLKLNTSALFWVSPFAWLEESAGRDGNQRLIIFTNLCFDFFEMPV